MSTWTSFGLFSSPVVIFKKGGPLVPRYGDFPRGFQGYSARSITTTAFIGAVDLLHLRISRVTAGRDNRQTKNRRQFSEVDPTCNLVLTWHVGLWILFQRWTSLGAVELLDRICQPELAAMKRKENKFCTLGCNKRCGVDGLLTQIALSCSSPNSSVLYYRQ